MCLIVVVLMVDMVGTECNVTFNQQHRHGHLRGLSIYTLTHSHKHKSEHDFSYDHISNICSQIHCARSALAHCRVPLTFLLQHTHTNIAPSSMSACHSGWIATSFAIEFTAIVRTAHHTRTNYYTNTSKFLKKKKITLALTQRDTHHNNQCAGVAGVCERNRALFHNCA